MVAKGIPWGYYRDTNGKVAQGWGDVTSFTPESSYKDFSKTLKSTPSLPILVQHDPQISEMHSRLQRLEKIVNKLSKKVNTIEGEDIIIRDVPYSQAKKEVAQYFKDHHGENIDAADIEEALCIKFSMAVEICEKLEKEGKIKEL